MITKKEKNLKKQHEGKIDATPLQDILQNDSRKA